jgi:hypothetical protein
MAVNLIRTARLFPGVPYAYAARASQGDLIFTAGACPLDEQGKVVAPGDVRAQMSRALRNLVTAWDEVAGFFVGHDAPSTLLGVATPASTAWPGKLCEPRTAAGSSEHERQPGN